MIEGMYYFKIEIYKNDKLIESYNIATMIDLLLDETITDKIILEKLGRSRLYSPKIKLVIEEIKPFTFIHF